MALFNKTGVGIITIIFWVVGAVIVWAMFAAPIISAWGHQTVVVGSYTGVEALFFENLNLFIGIVMLISIGALAIFGGGE